MLFCVILVMIQYSAVFVKSRTCGFGARYHDPVDGRFISIDPMAMKYPGLTPFHYCSNNPVNRIDPSGENDKSAMLEAGIKTVGGGLTYAAGWALQIKGVGVTIVSVDGFSALGVGLVVGGEALKVAGGFSAATGIADFRLAASVPDGIDANAIGNLSYEVAQGAGIEGTKLEIIGLTEDILTGGKNIGKLAVDGRS